MADDDPTTTARLSRRIGGDTLAALELLALVAIGGFAGSNLRYFAGSLLPGLTGTLFANATGSLVLGFLLYEAIYAGVLADRTHYVVGTGFLSSYTTYSTFAVQTAGAAGPAWMVANVVANYGLGLLGVLAGRELARLVDGRSA